MQDSLNPQVGNRCCCSAFSTYPRSSEAVGKYCEQLSASGRPNDASGPIDVSAIMAGQTGAASHSALIFARGKE